LGTSFSKNNWSELNTNSTSVEDHSSEPVFVIDASIIEKLPPTSGSPIRRQKYTELPKRVPIVIQRTIKVNIKLFQMLAKLKNIEFIHSSNQINRNRIFITFRKLI
jgi:hypothetical protein